MKNGLIIASKIFNFHFFLKYLSAVRNFPAFLRQTKPKLERFKFTSCSPNKFHQAQLLLHQFLWLLAIRRAQGLKKGP